MARVPDAAARGDPPDLGAETEQNREPDAVGDTANADPAGENPHDPDVDRGEGGVDDGLPRVGGPGSHQGHERQDEERGERRKGDVEAIADGYHVELAEGVDQPRPSMEEGVGEIEEVAVAGVETPCAEQVDDERSDDEPDADEAMEDGGRGGRSGGAPAHGPWFRDRFHGREGS